MIVKNRIKKHSEFQEVIANGEQIHSNIFTIYKKPNLFGYTRIGISVPKKSGNAVTRNKIKRQIRAAIAQSTNFEESVDIVLIVRKSFDIENFGKTKTEIFELFNK